MTAWPCRRPATRALWMCVLAGCLFAAAAPLHAAAQGGALPAGELAAAEPGAGEARAVEADDTPITVVVVRHARPGCAAVFERLIHDTFEVRNRTPGHLSTDFLRPAEPGSNAYTIIFKFDRMSHYRQWLASPERAVWLDRMAEYTEGPPQYQYHTGLDAWVGLPGEPAARSPEKYKTVAVTWLAIFPLVVGVSTALAPVTAGMPSVAATALTTAIVVPALGYGLMPVMTWAFRDWLYPPAPECRS